jgi:hypothetical protein
MTYHFHETKLNQEAFLAGSILDYEQIKRVNIDSVLGLN